MKRYMIVVSIAITLLLIDSSVLWSQVFEAGNKISVKVNAAISKDSQGLIQYDYTIRSLPESQQNVWNFMIIFKFNPDSILQTFQIPGWWRPDVPDDDTLSWVSWSAPDQHEISPGDSLSGFGFVSNLLPGITDFYAEGYTPPPYYEGAAEEGPIHGYDDLTPYGPGIVGKTVGPVLPSEPFLPIAFLDTLISYTHQAYDLGWIKNQKVVKHLDKTFEHAKKRLEKGSIPRAIKALRASVKRVETRKKRHLTSEAYALLRFNTEYLIDQLLDPDKIISVPLQFPTIKAAVKASQAGNIIEVSPGVYDELVKINKKNSIVLRTTGGLDGVTVNGFIVSKSHNVTIEGFVVDAGKTRKDGIMLEGGNSDIILEANVVKNSGKNHSGIVVSGDNPRTRIVNNRVHSNSANGIHFKKAKGGPQYVVNNTIVHNGWNGVHVARKQAIYLVNNIVSFNGTSPGKKGGRDGYGVLLEGKRHSGEPENITLLHNLIVGNHGRETSDSSPDIGNYAQVVDGTDRGNLTTSGTEGDGVSVSPTAMFAAIFVSETPIDLHLQESSVAIDMGLDDYSPPDSEAGAVPMLDFEGEIRPSEEAVDVGADERP